VAIVTGGKSGIGQAVAARLARAGARVSVLDVAGGAADDPIPSYRVDVGDERAVDATVDAIAAREGSIDYLICCAAIFPARAFLEIPAADWERTLRVNLTGGFLCCRAALRHMRPRGFGRIILFASGLARTPVRNSASYAASKGAIVQFTKVCASAWAKDNIQSNAVLPGWIDTDLTKRARAEVKSLNERVLDRTPAGRWGVPDDLSGIAVFLASPASDFVTGTAIPVDGGFAIAM